MKPVEPKFPHEGARLVVLAKDQPQYEPLPCAIDANGLVMTEWELTAEELATIINGGRIRLWTHTFRNPFQPVQLEVVE
jgi:hypothetical protein